MGKSAECPVTQAKQCCFAPEVLPQMPHFGPACKRLRKELENCERGIKTLRRAAANPMA
jgi:hypothetical protein